MGYLDLKILSFSIIYNLPKFFELEVTSKVSTRNSTEDVDMALHELYDETYKEKCNGSDIVGYL